MIAIQDQRFGVEIEVAGQSRERIAQAVSEATGGYIAATHQTTYDTTIVTDPSGRQWKIMNDSSIAVVNGHKGSEVVTPILIYSDLPLLQEVVRSLRHCGCQAVDSTSVHCHIDASPHTPQSLSRLAKMFYKNEDLIFQALQVRPERRERYCRPMDEDFIDKVAKLRPQSFEKLNECWFGQYTEHPPRYHPSRYKALNLVPKWRSLNTFEVRIQNGTLHSGRIKSLVQFCLALSAKALNSYSASHKKIPTDNPKFNFRVWLVSSLGMKGDEFKTARYHLTRYLPGNSAWRYGKPDHTPPQPELPTACHQNS